MLYHSIKCTSNNISTCVIFEHLTQAKAKGYITRGKFTTFKLKYKPPLACWSSVMMYLYLGRQVEMAYSDSCYSSPAGSLSSIPGIAPRQHLGHSSSQQFFKTFASGKWPPFNSYQLMTILMVMPKKGIEN